MVKKSKSKSNIDLFSDLLDKVKNLMTIVTAINTRLNRIESCAHDHNIKVKCPICQAEIHIDIPFIKLIKPKE